MQTRWKIFFFTLILLSTFMKEILRHSRYFVSFVTALEKENNAQKE